MNMCGVGVEISQSSCLKNIFYYIVPAKHPGTLDIARNQIGALSRTDLEQSYMSTAKHYDVTSLQMQAWKEA